MFISSLPRGAASLSGFSAPSYSFPSLARVALPIILLLGMDLPKAEAGPLAYSACILGCTGLPIRLAPACVTACLVSLFIPGP